MLLKTQGKFGNIRHTRSDFSKEPVAKTKKDQVQDKKIKNLNKKIKKIEFLDETKFVDTAAIVTIPETGRLVSTLNYGILQGDGASTRDGNQVNTSSLIIRAVFATDVDKVSPSRVRMIVFWDKQCNGADATVSAGAGSTVALMTASATVDGTLDHRNQLTIRRYDIIYDKVWTLNPQLKLTEAAGTVTDNQIISMHISKRFKLGRRLYYSASAGAITDIVSNSINVVFISDNDAEPPTVNYNMRLYYKDP